MTTLHVKGKTLTLDDGRSFRCSIGRGGFSADKHEGDGATPVGTFSLRECWYRPDRVGEPKTSLPLRLIRENDGWCDDPHSPFYNLHVKLPFAPSHETLWREDHAYDLIVPLGYNDGPIAHGKGSAIFMHCERENYIPTEGCVALAREDLMAILPGLNILTRIEISQS